MHFKKIIFLFPICLMLIVCSCRKDSVGSIDKKTTWEYLPIHSEQGFMNSASINGWFNILSPGLFYKNLSSSDASPDVFNVGPYEGAGRLKFPVSQNYYVFTDTDKVVVRSALNTESESLERVIDLNALDEDFNRLVDIPYWQGECMALSANNFLLFPYRTVKDGYEVPSPYFALAKITAPENSDDELDIESIQLIREDIFPGFVGVQRLQTFFNRFFVVIGTNTYRVEADGSMYFVEDKAFNVFYNGTALYAFAPNLNTNSVLYYKSADQGESWTLLGEIGERGFSLADLQYTLIDNKVVGFVKGQIFKLEISDTNYSLTELNNEGLSFADITSISLADDNTVFITSRCNSFSDICGIYFKPLDIFFEAR